MRGFVVEILIILYCFIHKFSAEYRAILNLRNFTARNLATATLQDIISE